MNVRSYAAISNAQWDFGWPQVNLPNIEESEGYFRCFLQNKNPLSFCRDIDKTRFFPVLGQIVILEQIQIPNSIRFAI